MLPTVVPGRDGAYSAFCGALGTANGGVAVVDAEALPAKAKRQLAEALQRTVGRMGAAKQLVSCGREEGLHQVDVARATVTHARPLHSRTSQPTAPARCPATQSLAAPGAPGLVVPQTATVWAACGLPDLIPADPSMVGAGASKRWAKPTVGCGGYDVVLSDASDECERPRVTPVTRVTPCFLHGALGGGEGMCIVQGL